MKKFDLNLALQGHPVCTRDGRKARIICTDRKGTYPIVYLVEQGGSENLYTATKEGKWNTVLEDKRHDLFMAPVKHEGWVNVYKDGGNTYLGFNVFPSKEEAEEHKTETGVDTIKIEWEE